MKYLSGKDYPWLCSKCRAEIDSVTQLMPELPDDESEDQEAPCTYIYDHALMCNGHTCWDSDFKNWSVREVWKVVDLLKAKEDDEAIKMLKADNPDIGTVLAENVMRMLKAELNLSTASAQEGG